MGFLDSLKWKTLYMTFKSDLNAFKKTSLSMQVDVGVKVWKDLQEITNMPIDQLNSRRLELCKKYLDLRHISLQMGASSSQDPRYAYPAIMESFVLTLTNEETRDKVMKDIISWLTDIGVAK
jgi:hypothetical protein